MKTLFHLNFPFVIANKTITNTGTQRGRDPQEEKEKKAETFLNRRQIRIRKTKSAQQKNKECREEENKHKFLYWFGNNPCLYPVPKQPPVLEIPLTL